MPRLCFAVTFVIYLFFFPLWVLISFPLFFQIESGCEIRVPELRFLPPFAGDGWDRTSALLQGGLGTRKSQVGKAW